MTDKQHTQAGQHEPRYTKVLDGRKQPIRGLWKSRKGWYYAQLAVEDHATGKKGVRRILLTDQDTKKPVLTTAEAIKATERLKVQREDNALPVLKRTPKFSECVIQYFEDLAIPHKDREKVKRASTIQKEKASLRNWEKFFGEARVDKIKKSMILHARSKRQAEGVSKRTVNLDLIALRNVLKFCEDRDWLREIPNVRPFEEAEAKKRQFFSAAEIESLCAAAVKVSKNGQEFSDYVRLMAYCGSRRNETLRLKWSDVDWKNQQLTINAESKGKYTRQTDFNPELEAHLKDMFARKAPDSEFLFPSPQRGDKDRSAKTFKETLKAARNAAKLPRPFTFHDCRHHFISICVMSGIDYMTIAKWVGHTDGGVLIGKVYGHLADDHRKRMAQKVVFTPAVVQEQTVNA